MQTEALHRIHCAEPARNRSVRALLKQQADSGGESRRSRK
jgi:hypothetical protein